MKHLFVSVPVIVNFPLEDDPSVAFVAWTTTPWTLPSNLALCVHPELTYVKLKGETHCLNTLSKSILMDNMLKKLGSAFGIH